MSKKRAGSTWISKSKFEQIEVGDELTFKYMIGKNKVTKAPYEREGYECVKVDFIDGPWANKNEIELIRQQIKSVN